MEGDSHQAEASGRKRAMTQRKLGLCPDCGKNMDFVGLRHYCNPAIVNKAPNVSTEQILINNNAAHQAKWRKANAGLNRLRAKEGMRKIRAQRADDAA